MYYSSFSQVALARLCGHAAVAVLLTLALPVAYGAEYKCTSFSFQGLPTRANAVNSSGAVVGNYTATDLNEHAYLRSAAGTMSAIDYPGAMSTTADGINDSGDIAGTYVDSVNEPHAYVRAASGTFTSFDPPVLPRMEDSNHLQVQIGGINNHGDVSGSTAYDGWSDGALPYIRYADGTFKTFPGVEGHDGNRPGNINDSRDFLFMNVDFSEFHILNAHLYHEDGEITNVDWSGLITFATGLNNNGDITGSVKYLPLPYPRMAPIDGPSFPYLALANGGTSNIMCPGIDPAGFRFSALSNDRKVAGSIGASGVLGVPTGREAMLLPSNSTWTFSAHEPGSKSGIGTIYLSNSGSAPLHILQIYIRPFVFHNYPLFDNPDFAIIENRCPPELAVGGTCSVSIQFTPTTVGNITAPLSIANDGNAAAQSIDLQGIGSGTAFRVKSPPNPSRPWFEFMPTLIGASSGLAAFYPFNYGNTAGPLGPISITGGNPGEFLLEENTCTSPVPAYNACKLAFRFHPTAKGNRFVRVTATGIEIDLLGVGK